MAFGFLTGVRVLDLSQFLPGPFAAQILADMGADVVKVEPPQGDPLRRLDPVAGSAADGAADGTTDDPSPYYRTVNGAKRVVRLDLKSDDGRTAFERLVRHADVLVESYRPGVLERLGLGPDRLQALNPRLVHSALSGFGQTGPARLTAGHDINYLAMTGALAATGPKDAPAIPWPPVADHAAALYAAVAVLAALQGRERSGTGAYIDTSLADAALAWQAWPLTAAAPPDRAGAVLNGGAAYYRVYETADGRFVSLGAIEEKFWANACAVLGHPEWAKRQTEPLPQDDLAAAVAAVFRTRTRDEWDAAFDGVDACYHPVLDGSEVATHPQVAARGFVQRHATHTDVAFPAHVNGAPPQARPAVSDVAVADVLADWKA